MIYFHLFIGFFYVGCFSFGGAYSAIPLIREVVFSNGWLTEERLSYMIAVSESTPGPIMVNLATYIGSSQAGILGAILATFAVVLPAFIIILMIIVLMSGLMENIYVKVVLCGLKPCIAGILFSTGLYMVVSNCLHVKSLTISNIRNLIVLVLLILIVYGSRIVVKKKISPVNLIFISAVLGAIVYGIDQ